MITPTLNQLLQNDLFQSKIDHKSSNRCGEENRLKKKLKKDRQQNNLFEDGIERRRIMSFNLF